MAHTEGRFYEADFPALDEIVVVQVKRIVDMGAYVSLLEYNGQEGMMLMSELSKRRIRSVNKLLRVGRNEICMVHRVDREKGYIDLSKKRVEPEDAALKEESFAKAKAVHGIMRHVASKVEVDVEQLCMKISWPLYRQFNNDAFDALRRHSNGDLNIWKHVDFSQPGEDLTDKAELIKEHVEADLKRRLSQQAMRLRAKIEVSCSEYEGIDAVKESLQKGLEVQTNKCISDLKIHLIAHPLFVITCQTREKELGLTGMQEIMETIKSTIESKGGVFNVNAKPEVVGADKDEKEESDSDGSDGSGDESDSDQEHMPDLDEAQMQELRNRRAAAGGDDDGYD